MEDPRLEKVLRFFADLAEKPNPHDGLMVILEVWGRNFWLMAVLEKYGCGQIIVVQPTTRATQKTGREKSHGSPPRGVRGTSANRASRPTHSLPSGRIAGWKRLLRRLIDFVVSARRSLSSHCIGMLVLVQFRHVLIAGGFVQLLD